MVHLLPPKSRAETPRRIPRPDYLSSFFGAAATRNGLKDLYLFAGTGVLDKMADVDDAISAGVGTMATPLGNVHAHGQDVLAVLPATQEVGTVAGLFAVVDRVEAATRAAGHEVKILADMAGELAALTADAHHWLIGPEYAALKHRLEDAHAAVEAALVEARRKVRLNDGGER
jgi:hypothetical protein